MTRSLSDKSLEQRMQSMLAMLDDIGQATLEDIGEDDPVRVISVSATVPLDPPYQQALFEYSEIYERRTGTRWELVDYFYEFRQRPSNGRRAHHAHEPHRYHMHCVDPRDPTKDHQYRGVEVTVFEAHSEFLVWYARSEAVNCFGLFPLLA